MTCNFFRSHLIFLYLSEPLMRKNARFKKGFLVNVILGDNISV